MNFNYYNRTNRTMMKKVLLGVVVAGLLAPNANAALLFLAADDGGDTLNLGPGETGNMSIMLTIRDIDPGFTRALAFLNDDDDLADGKLSVVDWNPGLDAIYGGAFALPADISWDGNNEYDLLVAHPDGLNWGSGTYTLVTLEILNNSDSSDGQKPITFEEGTRMPQIFTAESVQYVWGLGFDGIIPGFSDPGVGGQDNPFMINNVPEPATLALMAFGGLVLLRRRL